MFVPVSAEHNRANLKYITNFLAEKKIPYFIFFGTLLGVTRDNDIIKNDDDVDIYINLKDRKKLISVINETNFNIDYNSVQNKSKFVAENDNDKLIYDEFSKTKAQINRNISDYRLDFAVNEIYEFFWSKFCDVYIEECKKSGNTANLRPLLKEIIYVLHPFAPFITEEISSLLFNDRIIL